MDCNNRKKIQKISLELLKVFIKICEKNNLKYYIGGGTMLGAVRHKGFIPWDDDIDIDMPRKDFQKFLKIADEELRNYPNYDVLNYYRGNTYELSFKLVDKRIKYRMLDKMKDSQTYVGIDVAPIDGVPNNFIVKNIFLFKLNILRMCYRYSVFNTGVITNERKKTKREWYKCFLVFLGTKLPVEKIFKRDVWAPKYDKAMKTFNLENCEMAGTLSSQHGKKSIFPVEWYGNGTKYQFEDIEVIGVDNYDAWLTQLYGDYMKLPPEDKRIGHDVQIVK